MMYIDVKILITCLIYLIKLGGIQKIRLSLGHQKSDHLVTLDSVLFSFNFVIKATS